MATQYEAIIEAFKALGGVRTIQEIENWVNKKHTGLNGKDLAHHWQIWCRNQKVEMNHL